MSGDVDSDGDGSTDAQEALRGTGPNDPSDYLRSVGTQRTAGGIELSWTSKAGKSYDVLYSIDITSGSWEVIATVDATGDTAPYEDTDAGRTDLEEGYSAARVR